MKRLLCIILILCIACPFMGAFANTSEDVLSNTEDLNMLLAVGVLNKSDIETVYIDTNVSRGMFVKYAMKLYNTDYSSVNSQMFWDVDSNNPYRDEINAAANLGIIGGYSDGGFHPNNDISMDEAMAIVINMLGYKDYANYNGGYPYGYYSTVKQLSLHNVFNYGQMVSGKSMLSILVGALNSVMLKTMGNDGIYNMDNVKSKTLLNEFWNIHYVKGIVSVDNISGLYSNDGLNGNYIKVGDFVANNDYDKVNRYLGYTTECYYKTDDDGNNYVVYLRKRNNEEIKIDITDFVELGNMCLRYCDESGKIRTINFAYNTAYLYNGKPIDYDNDYNNSLFDGTEGNITFVDNNCDGVYDVVYIENYVNMTVRIVDANDSIIYGMQDERLRYTSDSTTFKCLIKNSENAEVNPKDFIEWDILTYGYSKDGNYLTVIAEYNKQAGVVQKIFNNADEPDVIVVNDKEYEIAESCYRDQSLTYYFGKNVTIRLNTFGKVAAIQVGIDSNLDRFALVVAAAPKSNFDDRNGAVKIMDTPNEDPYVLNLAQKITYDGKKNCTPKEVIASLKSSAVSRNLIATFIRYRLDENNNIYFIDTPQKGTNEEENSLVPRWTMDKDVLSYKGAGYLGLRYFKNEDTKFFGIPEKSKLESGDNECACYADFANDGVYSVNVYTMGTDTIFMAGAVIEKNDTLLTVKVNDERPMFVVKGISQILAENEGEYTSLDLISGTKEVSIRVEDDQKHLIANLDRGDVIRYETDLTGMLTDIHFIYDYDKKLAVNGTSHKYTGNNLTVCGTLLDIYENYLKLGLLTKAEIVASEGVIDEGKMYVLRANGYTVDIGRENITFEKTTTDLLKTWKNSTTDAYTVIYVMQYGQYIDALILK